MERNSNKFMTDAFTPKIAAAIKEAAAPGAPISANPVALPATQLAKADNMDPESVRCFSGAIFGPRAQESETHTGVIVHHILPRDGKLDLDL